MSYTEIKSRIKATIDQFYKSPKIFIEEIQDAFIYGVLQTALHLLQTEDYYEIKNYIYKNYNYDPGGCSDGQIELSDFKEDL